MCVQSGRQSYRLITGLCLQSYLSHHSNYFRHCELKQKPDDLLTLSEKAHGETVAPSPSSFSCPSSTFNPHFPVPTDEEGPEGLTQFLLLEVRKLREQLRNTRLCERRLSQRCRVAEEERSHAERKVKDLRQDRLQQERYVLTNPIDTHTFVRFQHL